MIRPNVLLSGLLAFFPASDALLGAAQDATEIQPANTLPLTIEGDLASQMVDGIDRFLLKEIAADAVSRAQRFTVDTSSAEAYAASLTPHRQNLAKCLGIRDARLPFTSPEIIAAVGEIRLLPLPRDLRFRQFNGRC